MISKQKTKELKNETPEEALKKIVSLENAENPKFALVNDDAFVLRFGNSMDFIIVSIGSLLNAKSIQNQGCQHILFIILDLFGGTNRANAMLEKWERLNAL